MAQTMLMIVNLILSMCGLIFCSHKTSQEGSAKPHMKEPCAHGHASLLMLKTMELLHNIEEITHMNMEPLTTKAL